MSHSQLLKLVNEQPQKCIPIREIKDNLKLAIDKFEISKTISENALTFVKMFPFVVVTAGM